MKTSGYSLNIGKGKIQFGRLPVATIRPMIDGEDCYPGFRFDIVWGPLVLPVAKMYHWRFWVDDPNYSQQWNNGKKEEFKWRKEYRFFQESKLTSLPREKIPAK